MADPRAPQVLALGDPGPLPFLGHFRIGASGPRSVLRVAGRLASAGSAVEACEAAGAVERELAAVPTAVDRPDDRVALLRGLWEGLEAAMAGLPASLRADLALLAVATDPRGVSVTGVGLAGCWFLDARQPPRPLVPRSHPLLSGLGVPATRPGAMTINAQPDVIFAELRHPTARPVGLPTGDLWAACGARR